MLENIHDEIAADSVIKRIIASLSEPFLIEKQNFIIKTSLNVLLDNGNYDELEVSCNAELGTSFFPNNSARLRD